MPATSPSRISNFRPCDGGRNGANVVPDSLEIFINEQRADLTVLRLTLSMFILHLAGVDPPTARERLQELKNSVIGAIASIETNPTIPGDERMKQMTSMRAERFFLELEGVVSENLNRMGLPGGSN
jgi:hypothetical protein